MRSKLLALAIIPFLIVPSVSAAPLLKVSSEVAQGISGRGLSVVLAPRSPISINFSGEKVASVTAGDRSQFVFNVSGSVVTLTRIKPLNFPGEYSGGASTTLHIMTMGSVGQKIYPVTIVFGSRSPGYSVVEVGGNDYATTVPVQTPPQQIPLLTSQVPDSISVPEIPKISKQKTSIPPPPPPVEIEKLKKPLTPKESPDETIEVKKKTLPEVRPKEDIKPKLIPSVKRSPKPSLAKIRDRKKALVAITPPQEPAPELTPSQRALLEMKKYQEPVSEPKKKD